MRQRCLHAQPRHVANVVGGLMLLLRCFDGSLG